MRIGEIASATGLTVRTLRHYEDIGLVTPTGRTDALHRYYGPAAVERLYRVSMLRSLGLPLSGIRESVDSGSAELRHVLAEHVRVVDEGLTRQRALRARLVALVERLGTNDPSEGLLDIVEDMVTAQARVETRISIVVYADLKGAFDYLSRVFGFTPGTVTYDNGTAVHAVLYAGDGEVWLHPESRQFGLASPRSLGAGTATMAVLVDDVDQHHRHAEGEGCTIAYAPVDQPYGFREYGAIDLEGHLWSFMRLIDEGENR